MPFASDTWFIVAFTFGAKGGSSPIPRRRVYSRVLERHAVVRFVVQLFLAPRGETTRLAGTLYSAATGRGSGSLAVAALRDRDGDGDGGSLPVAALRDRHTDRDGEHTPRNRRPGRAIVPIDLWASVSRASNWIVWPRKIFIGERCTYRRLCVYIYT